MFRTLVTVALLAAPTAAVPQAAPTASAPATTPAPAPIPFLVPTVVARFPHDTAAFTEGLIWHDGALYESIGYEGQSEVRRVRLADGKVLARAAIPPRQFGEGLAAWRDTLVSLTWHDGIAHRWNAKTLTKIGDARYTGEGWGLTADAKGLIRSDGSATLTFHDPVTMAERGRVTVTINGRALTQVNELEMIDGALYANVWHTPYILRIDPATGRVTAVLDLTAIVAEVKTRNPEAVLNGIAWDAQRRRLFVTGKLWPTLFEIAVPKE